MSQMLKSSGAMGAATLASRLLGMVREMVYSRFMGVGPEASAFKFAFQIPNLFRRLLGEGALTAAFIPIFKEKEKTAGDREMWEAANAVISGLIVATTALIGLGLLGLTAVLAWAELSAETRLMLDLLRVMLPYLLLVCLAAVFMGMLNARGHFFVPALGAGLMNVVMISAVFFLAPHMGATLATRIYALAVGILIAGLAQAGFQLPFLRREGFQYRWRRPWPDATVRQVLQRMIPATVGVAAFQINVLITYGFGFSQDKSMVAAFDYAVRLMELPQGVVAVSFATFLLPALAGLAVDKKFDEFRSTLFQGLSYLLFVNLLASLFLCVLARPIVRLLFEGGEFGVDATYRSASALSFLAPSLVAYGGVSLFARAFYALGDTKTPMKISVFCLAVNLMFALWLIRPFRESGLGVANTLSSFVNFWLLSYALRRKLRRLDLAPLKRSLFRMLGALILAGEITWLISQRWETLPPAPGLAFKLGAVFLPMTAGGLVYLAASLWLGIAPARDVVRLFAARLRKRK